MAEQLTTAVRYRSGTVGADRGARLLVAVAVGLAAIRLALLGLPYDRVVGLFDDDAFYYFGIARHIAHGDGSTFSGLDPTNGYHPLWLLALVPVFAVLDGFPAFVAVTVMSAVVMVASAVLLVRIGRVTGRSNTATLCAATPLLVTGVCGPSFFFAGMETGLLILATLAIALYLAQTDALSGAGADPGRRMPWVLGSLMALAVLARLDAVFAMCLLGLLAGWQWRPRWQRVLVLGLVPAVVLAGYVAINLALFGTAMPVSGQAKALGGSGLNLGAVAQFLGGPVVLGRETWLGALAVLAVPFAVAVDRARSPGRTVTWFGGIVLLGGVVTVVYYAVSSSWQLWPWYFSAAPLALALAGPALVVRLPRRPAVTLTAAGCIVLLLAVSVSTFRTVRGGVLRSAFIEAGPRVAALVDQLEPTGAPLAMGDRAGSVGFHLSRPLVHLEGLVGPRSYLDALTTGTVTDFLAQRRVGFYARGDADPGRPDPEAGPGCRRFTEPQQGAGPKAEIVACDPDLVAVLPLADGTSYRVWRYRPERNHPVAQ